MALNSNIVLYDEARYVNTKASEEYVHVKFKYPDVQSEWDGWVPVEYRRTGVSIPVSAKKELEEHLNNIYSQMHPANYKAWVAEQDRYWNATVLAEKLETIITRTTTNTRMRDFYDIYILDQLHGNTLNRQTLYDALLATAKKRGTERHLAEAVDVLNEVESSPVMQKLWESYRRKFSYAADLEWNIIMRAVRSLYALSEKESSQ